jgi:hypothetical protein
MKQAEGRQWIEELKKRWIIFSVGKVLLLSFAFALITTAVLFYFFKIGVTGFILAFVLFFALLSVRIKYWKISVTEIVRYIDLHFPEVEESSGLLLKPAQSLSFLEQLQAEKVNASLLRQKQPGAPVAQLKMPAIVLIGGMVFSFFLVKMLPGRAFAPVQPESVVAEVKKVKETVLPQISSFEVRITPPAYTGKAIREQKQFTILAETGATVNWQINTSRGLKELSFILNDNERVSLKSLNKEGTSWALSKTMIKPGFYQVVLEGKRSDFYQMEIIPDLPVSIKVSKPAQHSTVDIGQPQQTKLSLTMNDDYGITDAFIVATMASGKGEAVSFKEKKLLFNMPFNNRKQASIEKLISLRDLGMKPGDELYFYISAKDNHGQQSRSDTYFVSIQDTAELMNMATIDNGVNLVPEYFRSQRQIIIDTEKLLKEKATVTVDEFKKRSNDLGIDQKMLRLRYGKFLGEEAETSIGGHTEEDEHKAESAKEEGKGKVKKEQKDEFEAHDHGNEHKEEPVAFGNVQAIMDQYAHKHDNAEDATFFEPELKAQLKATLTEMWNAELKLRTYEPQQALPYEYKALRLLKDLQQKSRAYVAKTSIKTSPLKPEKRLTGDLAEIKGGTVKSDFEVKDDNLSKLKRTIGLLENMKEGQPRTAQDMTLLIGSQRDLVNAAAVSPGLYLPALKAVKKIVASGQYGKINDTDLAAAEKGINVLLGREEATPFRASDPSSSDLTKAYFNQLKRTKR